MKKIEAFSPKSPLLCIFSIEGDYDILVNNSIQIVDSKVGNCEVIASFPIDFIVINANAVKSI